MTSKIWVFYVEVELERGKFEWSVFNLECNKIGKKYFFTGKQTTCRIPQSFFEVEEQRLRQDAL